MWGKLKNRGLQCCTLRFIPTGVGKTNAGAIHAAEGVEIDAPAGGVGIPAPQRDRVGPRVAAVQVMGERSGSVFCLNNLGLLAMPLEQYPRAQKFFRESYALSIEIGLLSSQASSLHNLGMVAHQAQDYTQARQLYIESLNLKEKIGGQTGICHTTMELGKLALEKGRKSEAQRHLRQALKVAREIQSPPLMLDALTAWAGWLKAARDGCQAEAILTVIYHHPACPQDVRKQVQQISAGLEFNPMAAVGARESQTLDEIVDEVLGREIELGTDEQTAR